MVTHLNRNTVPNIEKNLRNIIALYLWNNNITQNTANNARPHSSHIEKAHGMKGTLSRTMSVFHVFREPGWDSIIMCRSKIEGAKKAVC